MFRVVGAGEERKGGLPSRVQQLLAGWRIAGELGPIASLEFLPFGWIVAEPVAQIVAGGCVPAPGIHRQRLFFHPPRPQAFHKESRAILFRGLLIHSLNLDHLSACLQRWRKGIRAPRRKRRNRTSESSAGCIAQPATYSPTRCPRSLQPLDQGVRSLSQLRKSNDTQDVRGTYSRAVGNSSDHPAELRARPGFHIFDLPPSLLLSAAGNIIMWRHGQPRG